MTGPELKQVRHGLGEFIGRRLSVADMAKLCGLAPDNAVATWRKWEEGEGPSGPVAAHLCMIMDGIKTGGHVEIWIRDYIGMYLKQHVPKTATQKEKRK